MVSKAKLLQLVEMEPVAKDATYEALKRCIPPSEDEKKALVLGKMLTNDSGVFELYVPADKPQDARVISRATVNRITGEVVNMEVFLPTL